MAAATENANAEGWGTAADWAVHTGYRHPAGVAVGSDHGSARGGMASRLSPVASAHGQAGQVAPGSAANATSAARPDHWERVWSEEHEAYYYVHWPSQKTQWECPSSLMEGAAQASGLPATTALLAARTEGGARNVAAVEAHNSSGTVYSPVALAVSGKSPTSSAPSPHASAPRASCEGSVEVAFMDGTVISLKVDSRLHISDLKSLVAAKAKKDVNSAKLALTADLHEVANSDVVGQYFGKRLSGTWVNPMQQEELSQRPRDVFHVYLERPQPSVAWGLGMERTDGLIKVHQVLEGSIAMEYNRQLSTAPAPLRFRTMEKGDLITCINGYTDPQEMHERIKSGLRLHLRLERLQDERYAMSAH